MPAPATTTTIDLTEAPGAPIPDFPQQGAQRSLTTASTATVGSVEVSVDITHTWIGDLELRLVSPSGTVALLQRSVGSSEDNLVRTFPTANAPGLASLVGQAVTGAWRLEVADLEAKDVGKLNSWRLLIKP